MICFLGSSHAAQHMKEAAKKKELQLTNSIDKATVIFVSEDTPTDKNGVRDLKPIRALIEQANTTTAQIILTSQVPPGFTRSLGIKNIIHQAETLRIKDAKHRAMYPRYLAVGGDGPLDSDYTIYLNAFDCPILRMSWEDAEFSKIAVNMFLASQVDTTNRLAAAAKDVGANWNQIKEVLARDNRIGPYAYLDPGRWQDSLHLLRDSVTLKEIERPERRWQDALE